MVIAPKKPNLPFASPHSATKGSAVADPAENRRATRYPFVAAAEIVDVASRMRLVARTSDIAMDGCYIDTLSPLPAGLTVLIRIEKDKKQFQATGNIVYAVSGMGLGVSFTQMQPDDREVLRGWIATLKGDHTPELVTGAPIPSTPSAHPVSLSQSNPGYVLHELIRLLIRKRLIDESEGAELLRQMFR